VDQTNDVFEPTPAETNYLERQLANVSRSFALVLPFVEPPTRHYLAAAYLLCRVVDNIEDCTRRAEWKDQRFGEFLRLLDDPGRAGEVLQGWNSEPWPGLTHNEARLMGPDDGLMLWQIYAQMPEAPQKIVRHWTSAMAQGMQQLGDPDHCPCFVSREGVEVLREQSDYDGYCYFVAGTVGNMASELIIRQYGLSPDVAEILNSRAEACGRSLQKTNIVKDFAEDLARGICYLPDAWLSEAEYRPLSLQGAAPVWKSMVLVDVLTELRGATDYLLALPYGAAGYRRASLMCLLPAYQTLLLAAQRQKTLFTSKHRVKISKPAMVQCLVDSQRLLFDNDGIRRYSQQLESAILGQFRAVTSPSMSVSLPS
jgi:farnesyl-diphosphate farnesyltransferase